MNNETFTSHSTSMHKTASTRNGRQIDLSGAASGYGGGYCCDTGVDLPTLLALLAGISSIFAKKSQLSIDLTYQYSHGYIINFIFHHRDCSCHVFPSNSDHCFDERKTGYKK